MGQGKPEALAHCLAGVWGRLHAVVVADTVSVCMRARVREQENSMVKESG